MTPVVAPYGTWPSPVTVDLLTSGTVGLRDIVGVVGDRIAWVESRPEEGGREVLVASGTDATMAELAPAGFSARTLAHEYGGRCWTAAGGGVVTSSFEDQRLWLLAAGSEPVALTPAPAVARAVRFADPVPTPDGHRLVAVRETHRTGAVDNELVTVALDGSGSVRAVASGRDFYAAPTVSPDGTSLAWLCWDHPNMPWDDVELWVATLGPDGSVTDARRRAGGAGESVQQPRWSPDGRLHWVSDRTGWWNLYAEGEPRCPLDAEFGVPGWVFGSSTYCFGAAGELVATWTGPDGSGIGVVANGSMTPWDLGWDGYRSLRSAPGGVVAIAMSPTRPSAVVHIDATGRETVRRAAGALVVDPAALSAPERLRYPTAGGEHAWALVYPPRSATHAGPGDERPPLVVMSHGGPTAAASSALDLEVQWWTTRGFAVADVDYRGSTGYGRAYRQRLRGQWGICDVEDCAAVATWLAAQGRVDPARCVIRGGSAGGFTTLAALAFTDVFAAGGDHYGVADLEALAADTHKFESRYLDGMIGPWPEAAGTYRARSPIHHLDGFDRPLIIFQGLEDLVVPPSQSEMIHRALLDRGVPVAYLAFEGEQHGFRRSETLRTVAQAELSFFGVVLGFRPDGAVEVSVDNMA